MKTQAQNQYEEHKRRNSERKKRTAEHDRLFAFFKWFRTNGEKHYGNSIEGMIDIYLNEKNKTNG